MSESKFSKVPAAAFMCASGTVELSGEDKSDKRKTSPVRLKARSGQPIEHWFWGKVVHDLSGMRMHKNRLPIDYAHNDSEVLGYLNHFDHSTGDLIASGAITPFKADDRASEVLFKMREGVPYEASIFFGGDGIKVQELAEGEVADVNGYRLEGPAVIVREWPLRGVAICPYGADMNTESAANFAAGKEYAVTVLKNETQEKKTMSETKNAEAVAADPKPEIAPVASAPVAVEAHAVEAKAESKTEDLSVKVEAAVDAEAKPDIANAEPKPEELKSEEVKPAAAPEKSPRQAAIDEFCSIEREFGADIATAIFKSGGTFEDAKAAYLKKMQDENGQLKAEVAELRKQLAEKSGKPADFAQTEKKPGKLFNTGR